MQIEDRGITFTLADTDPRAIRIRRILLSETPHPERVLWDECTDAHRSLLRTVAQAREIPQVELETTLQIDGVGLRGLTTGLSKVVKRLGVPHPLRSTGSRRETRRFSVTSEFRQFVLRQGEAI